MPERKRVLWDEKNLQDNEAYRRLNPVKIPIVEPKTPYVHGEFDEEGNFEESNEEKTVDSTWDPHVNAFVRRVVEDLSKEMKGPVAPVSATGRPMLSASVVNGELLEKQHVEEFKRMRRAVYADEGAMFKSMISKSHHDQEKANTECAEGCTDAKGE